ncbi:hypothetical protein Plhal304r1_c001g0002801 [Plasmopara halstedii]
MIVKETSACDLPILVLTVAIDVERTLQFVRGSVGVKKLLAMELFTAILDISAAIGSCTATGYKQLETTLHGKLLTSLL